MSVESSALLQVVVLHPQDAEAAVRGGADRLLLTGDPSGAAPLPAQVSAVCRETDVPVRVSLGGVGEIGPAEEFLALGASGIACGFLDRDLEIDRDACISLLDRLRVPWTFTHFDQALNTDRAWRDVVDLPYLDAVASAGSTRGLTVGGDEIIQRAKADPPVAQLLLAAGGLQAELVPWLIRAGVRQFAVGSSVRPDRSWTKAYVDSGYVRAWRMLIDDALSRAEGIEPE